jgi:nicotinamide mononucleotide transporter
VTLDTLFDLIVANRLEILAVITGIISVYLSTRENIWSWPTAIVNVSLYFVVFYEAKLYADMGLQVVYFVLSLYGWYEWLYGGENRTELHVSRVSRSLGVRLAVLGVVSAAVLGTALARFTDASLPYVDSATTTTSLVAQWMMTRKILENWAVWVAVDVVYIGMFVYKKLYLTTGLYAVFLVLAIMGYVQWKRSLEARELGGSPPREGGSNGDVLSRAS